MKEFNNVMLGWCEVENVNGVHDILPKTMVEYSIEWMDIYNHMKTKRKDVPIRVGDLASMYIHEMFEELETFSIADIRRGL